MIGRRMVPTGSLPAWRSGETKHGTAACPLTAHPWTKAAERAIVPVTICRPIRHRLAPSALRIASSRRQARRMAAPGGTLQSGGQPIRLLTRKDG
jgi:hypothetical protein